MAMRRSDFKKQLQEGLNTVFGLEYSRHPETFRQVFEVANSRKAYEEDVIMSGFGAAQVKAEGAGVAYDEGQEGWSARYSHDTVALAFSITEEAVEDNLYGDLGAKYSRALARSMQHTKEIKGAAVLNNGFSSSYTGGDGKELFATDHPLLGGGTLSNELATPADLSETSLEQAIIQIGDWTDERGIPINATAVKLAIRHDNQFNATRILKSMGRAGTADNDLNAIKAMGMLQGDPVVWRYLTDPDAWFLLTDVNDGLKHMVRKGIAKKVEGDFESGNMRYRARERYSFGWTDWRGAFGSAGV
jgi:hypothetical protein